jgi:PTS system galactitol-specific IIA component
MMAILDPDAQIETLQNMMGVFQNSQAVAEFKAAKTEKELFEVAHKYIG